MASQGPLSKEKEKDKALSELAKHLVALIKPPATKIDPDTKEKVIRFFNAVNPNNDYYDFDQLPKVNVNDKDLSAPFNILKSLILKAGNKEIKNNMTSHPNFNLNFQTDFEYATYWRKYRDYKSLIRQLVELTNIELLILASGRTPMGIPRDSLSRDEHMLNPDELIKEMRSSDFHAYTRFLEKVKEQPFIVHALDFNGQSPLMVAIKNSPPLPHKRTRYVDIFLESNVSITDKDNEEFTVLDIAIQKVVDSNFADEDLNILNKIILKARQLNLNLEESVYATLALLASEISSPSEILDLNVKLLSEDIKHHRPVEFTPLPIDQANIFNRLIIYKNEANNNELIRLVEARQYDINAQTQLGMSPFLMAVESKNSDIVNYLLSKNANTQFIDYRGFTALDIALKAAVAELGSSFSNEHLASLEILDKLLEVIPEKDKHFNSLPGQQDPSFFDVLKIIAQQNHGNYIGKFINGYLETAKNYEDDGKPVKFPSLARYHALNHAKILNTPQLERVINRPSFTIFDVREILDLVSRGADVNIKNARGWTPLMIATHSSNVDAVRFLIEAGADLNAQTHSSRQTALMLAADGLNLGKEANFQIIGQLLSAKADLTLTDSSNMKASEIIDPESQPMPLRETIQAVKADLQNREKIYASSPERVPQPSSSSSRKPFVKRNVMKPSTPSSSMTEASPAPLLPSRSMASASAQPTQSASVADSLTPKQKTNDAKQSKKRKLRDK